MNEDYEFCPNCEANLTLQKGYSSDVAYWVCLGCGQMLINPELNTDTDIIWRCDNCGELLNVQKGFDESLPVWICRVCGYENSLDDAAIYESEDERISDEQGAYKGLSDEEVLELSQYKDIDFVGDRDNIILIEDVESHKNYIKKLLETYDRSVYDYLINCPIEGMPRIKSLYESRNCLIVIEEYIKGCTVDRILKDSVLAEDVAIDITIRLCIILDRLHNQPTPIVHRDIKPSNVIITSDSEVYLLDVNVAKFFDSSRNDDTRYLGTEYFAAPEQAGFGFTASNPKSDIYALGVLMNVMITGTFPKEKRVEGKLWPVIKKCMSLEADKRYTASELSSELKNLRNESISG